METGTVARRWIGVLAPLIVGLCAYLFVPSLMHSCRGRDPRPDPYLEEDEWDDADTEKLAQATSDLERFYAMGDAARVALKRKQFDEARELAEELLVLTERLPANWNHGNAVHDAHIVLGYLALEATDVADAKKHLIAAGRTQGSPQLDTFGPNMSLAKRLLQHGEREVVLEYFELCRRFWKGKGERLDRWKRVVEAGRIPDFGVALIH